MYRINRIVGLVSRNLRPAVYFPQSQILVYRPTNDIVNLRSYCNKKGDGKKYVCTVKPPEPCKPTNKSDKCKQRPLPYLQECQRPNLMSECPKPDCPYDPNCKKKSRSLLILALLVAAATMGALYMYILQKKQKHPQVVTKKIKKERVFLKIPKDSKDIPVDVPYLLIGGGTAAFAAFRAIKSNDPTAKVLVITNEEFYPYMRPPLSKELWFSDDQEAVKKLNFKQWNGTERSLFYEPDDFYINCEDLTITEHGGVAVARGWDVSHIDVINRVAHLEGGHQIKYGKCLIATGSSPKNLDIFENADKKVLERTVLYRNVYDFQCLHERLKDAKTVAVIGGGFLGSELACAFGRRTKDDPGFKVYQVFKESGHMGAILPEYLSFWTTEKVKKEGVTVIPNAEITGVCSTNDMVHMNLNNGHTISADLVIVAVGAAPNTSMATKSDLEIDEEFGGYLVNTELQARSHLFVAGDAACFYDTKLGRRRIEHHDNAVISGRLAGENMTGAGKPYLHQSMFWSDLGPDIGYEAIGIVDSCLPTVGVFAKATDESAATNKDEEDECAGKGQGAEPTTKHQSDSQIRKMAERRRQQAASRPGEDFSKGVIFYLRDDIIVGIVLWNVFNRMSTARQVLKDQCKYEDLNEVAKLFNIHEEE